MRVEDGDDGQTAWGGRIHPARGFLGTMRQHGNREDHQDETALPSYSSLGGWDKADGEAAESMEPGLDRTLGVIEAYLQEPSPYVRPEYDPAYQGPHNPIIRPGKERAMRRRTRVLVYLLLGSLFTCGGVVAGGVLSLSYLQQAIPQLYARYATGADTAITPPSPATSASPVTTSTPGTPGTPAVPTVTSVPTLPP